MRRLVFALSFISVAAPAVAGDNSWLRGSTSELPTPYVSWSGFYAGGTVGADFHGLSFSNDGNALLSNVRNSDAIVAAVPMQSLAAPGSVTNAGPSFGGFVGYNYQIDDLVLGLELGFSEASMTAAGAGSNMRLRASCRTVVSRSTALVLRLLPLQRLTLQHRCMRRTQ